MMNKQERQSRLQNFEREAMSHLDALLKTASRIARPLLDAEDVVQETYLRAWKHFDSFEAGTNCRAWLFRIMFNVIKARSGVQSKRLEIPMEEEVEMENRPGNVVFFDPLKRIEGQEALSAATRLSLEHREVLWLVVVEEFSYREAAEILDTPVGTVMSRLHRARRELRKLLVTDSRVASGMEQ
ncbi:MAG: sigma-70 family RNA polymerase sigma factor [Acidobacteria bacterium]|nr:sigma-70 family RNA polymerase sigma factor [Acidobacteriota bacterium]